MKRVCSSLLALIFLAVLGGCNSVNTVEPANPQATPNLIAIKKVETDPALGRKVSVLDVNEGKRGDLMFVQVQLENLNYGPEDFNYQFSWIEQDGFEVQSPPALWKSGFILGREKIFLTAGMFGLGAGVRFARLRRLGGRPLMLGLASWTVVAGLALGAALVTT